MDKRLFDVDPVLGLTEYFYYDADNDKVIIQQVQDTTRIIEQNKALLAQSNKSDRWGDWQKVATIPMALWADLNAKGITKDKKAFKAWLNSPDNRFFRTREGKV